MIRHCILLISLCCLQLSLLNAQKLFSMKDAITWGEGKLFPSTLQNPGWIPGGNTYYYTSGECLVFRDALKERTDSLKLGEFNFALKQYNGIFRNTLPPLDSMQSVPTILNWKNERQFRFVLHNIVFLFDLNNRMLQAEHGLGGEEKNKEYHPAQGHIAYTVGQNAFVKCTGANPVQLSHDSLDGIVNGVTVHREEFGIKKGLFWSDDGSKLAWYRMDESMVTTYPIYDLDQRPAGANFIRYPFAGKTSHHVKVWVYDVRKKKKVEIQTDGPDDQYLTNISFDPKGEHIFIVIVNREQNQIHLNKYRTETGEFVATLLEETHPKYVEPEDPMWWIDQNRFIWLSERDGYKHAYLYDKNGILQSQLTKGNWVVTKLLGCDEKDTELYFMSTLLSPLDRNLCKVNLKTLKISVVTKELGVHNCLPASSKRFWIDLYSAPDVPGEARLIDTKTGKTTPLMIAPNALSEYEMGSIQTFPLTADDGTTPLYCRMILPAQFDSTKKYPVVVYVYGGPHLQLINNGYLYGSNLWMHYMAQRGFIVFSLDNRGSANRGLEFENVTHRSLGSVEMRDQMTGVNWLLQRGYVDKDNIAVHGWSFGGFMTISLLTHYPGVFKTGVAGGPVIDWSMYEVMYTERYMDHPDDNPEGYAQTNLLNQVKNLNDNLLVIHGTSDDVVLWQHSLSFLKRCIDEGVLIDYFVYPEHPHNVLGKDRVHLYEKITNYLLDSSEN